MAKHAVVQSDEPLVVQLSAEASKKLRKIAKKSGRTTDFLVQEAIERYFEDLADIRAAEDVLARRQGVDSRNYTLEELERELGLER